MFEEIWNRKINKINKTMFEIVIGTQLWVLIFCKSCLRFCMSDVMKMLGMCGTYFPKYRTITSGTNKKIFCCSLATSQWTMVGSSDFYAESWREKSMLVTVTVSTFSTFSLFQADLHLPLGSPSILWSLSQRCYQQQ